MDRVRHCVTAALRQCSRCLAYGVAVSFVVEALLNVNYGVHGSAREAYTRLTNGLDVSVTSAVVVCLFAWTSIVFLMCGLEKHFEHVETMSASFLVGIAAPFAGILREVTDANLAILAATGGFLFIIVDFMYDV